MPRFFVKNNQINNDKITIIDEDVKHIKNVLRKQIGDKIEVCNQDTGNSYKCEIEIIAENEIETKIIEEQKNIREKIKVDIYQGLPKSDKMELIIQKNTEVGIKSIVPVIMERTVVKLDEKIASKKLERWQKIAEIAAKQSMRDIIPQIGNITKLKDIDTTEFDAVLVAYENEEHNMLKTELQKLERKIKSNNSSEQQYNIAIVIGPEGGISEKELVMLAEKNAKFVSLGKRILRTETAGVVMAGNIIYELEYNS